MTLEVGPDGIPVIVVADGGTLLVELGGTDDIGDLLSAALDGDVVLVLRGVEVLVELVPLGVIGVAVVQVVGLDLCGGVDTGPDPEVAEFVAGHDVLVDGLAGQGRDTVLGTDGDVCVGVVRTTPGGDVDDTVCSTGSVDGGGRSVLEDRDGEDVVRVQRLDGVARGRHAVDDVEGRGGSVERTDTVEAHRSRVVTGHTAGGEDRKTCDLTLQLVESRCRRCILDDVRADRGDGTDEVTHLSGGTVTHDDGVLQCLGIGLQLYVYGAASRDRDLGGEVTDGGEDKRSAGRNGDRVCTVDVGGVTRARALDLDGGERNGLSS